MAIDLAVRAIGKLYRELSDRKLAPPTESETTMVAQIKACFKELPQLETDKCLPSEKAWLENINRLRELVLGDDPSVLCG